MACGGCSGAVTRILTKISGVESVEPNLETQKVKVVCSGEVSDEVSNRDVV